MTQFADTLVRRPTTEFLIVQPGWMRHPSPIIDLMMSHPCSAHGFACQQSVMCDTVPNSLTSTLICAVSPAH